MADESDGIEEALEGTVRMVSMAAMRVGSELARARQEYLRRQERSDDLEARQLHERFEAEKQTAVAGLARVQRPEWWDQADARQIGNTLAVARAWAPEAEGAARAEQTIQEQLAARHGVDVNHKATRGPEVDALRRQMEQTREELHQSHTNAERIEAAVLVAEANRQRQAEVDWDTVERSAQLVADTQLGSVSFLTRNLGLNFDQAEAVIQHLEKAGLVGEQQGAKPRDVLVDRDGVDELKNRLDDYHHNKWAGQETTADAEVQVDEVAYDSAERRLATAQVLEERGVDHEVATSRVRADTGVAKPATMATVGAGRGTKSPKARKSTRGAQLERPGLER